MKGGRRPRFDSPLYGVEGALDVLRRHLRDEWPLITLVGGPGAGKTRLAAEVWTQWGAGNNGLEISSQAGVSSRFWCDLTDIHTLGGLVCRLHQILSLTPPDPRDTGDLLEALGHRLDEAGRALLVLDPGEHLPLELRRALGQLSELAPRCTVLVASRARLGLPLERTVEVPPLPVPGPGEDPSTNAAFRLFVDRAFPGRREPLAVEERRTVCEIVSRLDGIPLAIELAAARCDVLGPAGILARLDDPAALLRRKPINGPSRHDSIWAAIDSSWALLDEVERSVLAQLTVFEGGFTLSAAEHVVELPRTSDSNNTAGSEAARAMVDVVQALHDQSLIRRARRTGGAATLLEIPALVRVFAAQREPDADLDCTRLRHARYTLEQAVAATRDDAGDWENLRTALAFALAGDHPEVAALALPALVASGEDCLRSILPAERRSFLDRALALVPDDDAETRGWLQLHWATFAGKNGGRHELERLVEDAAAHGLGLIEAHALYNLGRLEVLAAPERALERLRRAQTLFETAGDTHNVARTIFQMARGHQFRGRNDESIRCYRRSLALFQSSGRRGTPFVGLVQVNLGRHLWGTGRIDEAIEALRPTAAEDVTPGQDEPLIASAYLAGVLYESGRIAEAEETADRALQLARRMGLDEASFDLLQPLAAVYVALGRPEVTLELFAGRLPDFGDHPLYGVVLRALGGAAEALRDNLEDARTALDDARRRLPADAPPRVAAVVDLCCKLRDVARCRHALLLGDAERARAHHRAARPADVEDDSREPMVRLIRSALDRQTAQVEAALARTESAPRAPLVVDRSHHAFRPPDGESYCLKTRRALWALLETLAQARLDQPGVPVPDIDLCLRTWGDEGVTEDAAANRLRVSLTALRKQGLDGLIVRKQGGYMLKPELTVLLVG